MRGDRGGLGQKRHGVVAFWPFPTIRRFTRQSLPPTEGRSGCPECHWDLAGRLGDHLSLGLSRGDTFRPCKHGRKDRLAQDSEQGDSEW